MTERTHTLKLTDAQLLELRDSLSGMSPLLNVLPKPTSKDADAGLSAQPWERRKSVVYHATIGYTDSEGYAWSAAYVAHNCSAPHSAEAVTRAILAAPKAIKAWRNFQAWRRTPNGGGYTLEDLDALAAEVLAVADGEA